VISEIVVLLGFLGFLCIRNDYVRRRGPFVLSILFWGAARLLMELNFKVEPTGELKYDWASVASCTAAACLVACVLCICWACWRPHRLGLGGDAGVQPAGGPAERPAKAHPEDRIRQLVEKVD